MNEFGEEDWIIVVEAAPKLAGQHYNLSLMQSLVERLWEWEACGLHDRERYALQLRLTAPSPLAALNAAVEHQARAHRALNLPRSSLVRAEVLTYGDYHRSCDTDLWGPRTQAHGDVSAVVCEEAYTSTRALLHAGSMTALSLILAEFTYAVGAAVQVGPMRDDSSMTRVHIGLAGSDHLHAVAEPISVAGMMIERCLPSLVDDAKRVASTLTSDHVARAGPAH